MSGSQSVAAGHRFPDAVATDVPWWRRDGTAVVVLVVVTALFWWMRRTGPGWSMEEAMMLQAPERVLAGAVPGADFDWFYGPLSLLIPAGTYAVFGPTLLVGRAVGAVYAGTVGVALYYVGRRWSYWIGLAMGLIAVAIGGLSMTALPIMGAIGGLVGAVAFAVSGRSARARAVWVGLACAFATGLRPDFALFSIVLLVVLGAVRAVGWRTWVAFAAGLVPFAWPVLGAGFGVTWRNLVGDAMHVASERHLPWHPDLGGLGLLAMIGVVTALAAVVIGVVRRRTTTGVGLLGLGVIGVCLFPEYLQRADRVHLIYFTMVPLATVVPVVWELVGGLGWFRIRPTWRQVTAVAVAAIVLLGLRPKFVARATARDAKTFLSGGGGYAVEHEGGVWYYRSAAAARDHRQLVETVAAVSTPGDRLFVGPLALDRPHYFDGSFYTLLPGLTQHTHFYDFHPRLAHVAGDRLAADVADADVVVLCDIDFEEANLSAESGSTAANDVVDEQFTAVDRAGRCTVYLRNGEVPS